MVGRRTSTQPTAACEKAEVTCSENEVDGEGLTSVVQTLRSYHRAGRRGKGGAAGVQAGEGQGRITERASNLLWSPPANPEVPIHPERPIAEKLTRSAPVTQGRRRGLSSQKANVYHLSSAILLPDEKSQEFTTRTWLLKSCLGHLIKRPEGNTDKPGPLPTHTRPLSDTITLPLARGSSESPSLSPLET